MQFLIASKHIGYTLLCVFCRATYTTVQASYIRATNVNLY